jgi:hypothetical protein
MTNIPQKKICLVVFMALLALAAVSAEAFVFAALDHDHIGEHCQVCLHIQIAGRLLECLGRIGAVVLLAGFPALLAASLVKRSAPFSHVPFTLIALKIQFNS